MAASWLLVAIATGRVVNRIVGEIAPGWQPPAGQRVDPDDGRPITDTRTLADAKADARARVLASFVRELDALDDAPALAGIQWWAIGALKDNAGVAFASWPAATRTTWNNIVQPQVDSVIALVTRLRTARQAIVAAGTRDAADAVVF